MPTELHLINQTQELTIGSLFITDAYHLTGTNMPNQIVKDIIYPMTTGRKAMLLGAEHNDETSLGVQFAHEPPNQNIIYAIDYNEFWDRLAIISDAIKSSLLHTIACHAFSVGNMRIQFSMVGLPGVRFIQDQQIVWQAFTLQLFKYRV